MSSVPPTTATNGPRRSELRCAVDWNAAVPGEFITGPVDNPLVCPCTLADLSLGGCAVRIETLLQTEPQIAIVRFTLDDNLQLESAGRVCWKRQASIGYRTYGLKFRRQLSADLLERWIDRGIINRREKQRRKVKLPVTLRRGDADVIGDRVLTAAIHDFSATGLQLDTNLPLSAGERIMLTLPDGRGVMAAVVWNAVIDGSCRTGCVLVNRISSDNLVSFFNHYKSPPSDAPENMFGRLKRCLTGGAGR